jgi:integrase
MFNHFLILPISTQKGIINYAKITPTQSKAMATFRKRNNSWRAEVYKNGKRKSASFDTKAQAKAWAAKVESEIDAENLETPDENNKTVADAFERYVNEVSVDKKGVRYERIKLKAFSRDHLATIKLSELMPSDLADWRDSRLKKVSGSSVNRELNLISAVLGTAKREWGWLAANPVSEIRRPKNPKPRDRRISEREIQQILDALDYNDTVNSKSSLLAVYFLLAIETAMRLRNVSMTLRHQVGLFSV